LRVLFPHAAADDLPTAVLSSTSGGLVGGDRLDIRISVAAQAQALATVQAAEKVYRSAGPTSVINVELTAAEDSWLEWLPQETILFENARLRRLTKVDLQAGARLLAGEVLVLGRLAGGERFSQGVLREAWEVRRNGRLCWADALHLEREIERVLDAPAGFGGCRVCATAIFAAEDAGGYLDTARELLPAETGLRVGVTHVGGLLLIRWLGHDPLQLRNHFGRFWANFRCQVAGLPARLPRLWHV
jgi:urease accessory protein